MSLSPGLRLGPYEITALLGEGGMGQVYRAHDTRLDRDVAVKVLSASLSSDPERVRRFSIEARATSALNHPNILAIYDVGHEAAPPAGPLTYIVSELLEGQTLRSRLEAGRIPLSKALDWARQVAAGLAAAHAKGIAHRD